MVSQVAAPSAGLDALPARPPTPPRERQNDIDAKLILDRHPLASRLTIQTPPNHSPSSVRSTNDSSRRSRKRVEFTVQAEYRDPPKGSGKENEHKNSTPIAALSSAGTAKPLKSILKPTSSPSPPNPLDPSAKHGEPGSSASLAAMLESTIKQLAGNDRDSKVDAYTMLVRALKTSTNLPDRIALQSKMSLFMQFIQRDVASKGGNGAIDSSLINHSLTLLCTFLHFPAIASSVSSDFGVFIIDHCIRSFEDQAMPKDVVRHLMQVVVSQDFSAKVMSSDRVGRLVTALRNIENHMTGKSIIMSRILIYRKLLRQSTPHMVSHSDWLLDLFTDMLSSIKEIRAAAIALGLEAGFTAAKEKQIPKKVQEILQMSNNETLYVEWYAQRLTAMAEEKSSMSAVPQTWSVIILLLRCPVERWEFFDPWLKIIQRCFNSGDYQTKLEANYAWNRLVYTQHLYPSSFSKTVKILCQPFNQLRRRGKQPDEFRKVVIGGICNIYYYAFKPNTSPAHVDQYWDACVKTLMRTLAFPDGDVSTVDNKQASCSDNVSQAAIILSGLFDSSSVRIWKEDRIAETVVVKPNDLPALDPKWIRRNAVRVFSVVDPILHRSFLDLADPSSNSSKLWVSLIGSVATAGSKEIKVSVDTANFLGHALSLLTKIWTGGLDEGMRSPDAQLSFLKAVETYVTIMVLSMGHLPFTEKLLSMNKQNTFTAVSTPSHRSAKGHGPTRSPLQHLFSILTILPPGISDGEVLSNLFKAVFGPFMFARPRRSQRELAQELIQTPALDGPVGCSPWIFIAGVLCTPFDQSQCSNSSSDSANQFPIGHEFRDLVKHLEKGINHTPNLPWPQWLSLYQFAIEQATELSGEAGCSVAVVEPLAKAIWEGLSAQEESVNSNLFKCGIQLLCAARQPRDRQVLDAARRRLWGTTVAGARSASFDPFDNLYRLSCRLLEILYARVDMIDENAITSLITETSRFLSRANLALVFKSIVQLQQGLGPWIQDVDERYGSKQRPTVAEAVTSLWDRICSLFSDTILKNLQLDAIEQLLCRAFTSKHRHIVNSTVLLWNQAFENETDVQYPEALKDVLLSLRPYVDIALPSLDASLSGTHNLAPLFVDSQEDLDATGSLVKYGQGPNLAASAPPLPDHLETPRSSQASPSSRNKSNNSQTRSRSRSARLAKRARTPKLRHDDSQVQFALIEEASPSKQTNESQVLTDRQREVRERQLENAALFPSIRSSPKNDHDKLIPSSIQTSHHSNHVESPLVDRSATPKATRSFDYVSSTPTPRRGQTFIAFEDHEMGDDVPSSPPEPRRNLLPEMRPHSRNSNPLGDIPISSSPISGSPVPKALFRYESERSALEDGPLCIVVESAASQELLLDEHSVAALPRPATVSNDEPADNSLITRPAIPPSEIPTEKQSPKDQVSPKSDNEVYVDALTSPAPKQRPSHADLSPPISSIRDGVHKSKDRSFEMSDAEERSMARLVIELDSRKCEPLPSYDSPEKGRQGDNTKECITVHTGSERGQAPPGKSQNSRSPSPVQPPATETDSSQTSVKRYRRKRKRTADKTQSIGGKRPRHNEQLDAEDTDAVMGNRRQRTESVEIPDGRSLAHVDGSPDLACEPDNASLMESFGLDDDVDPDTVAVNLQLITEASQQSKAERHTVLDEDETVNSPAGSDDEVKTEDDEQMEDYKEEEEEVQPPNTTANAEVPPAELSAVEKITASLREGLQGLRSATLTREDVYKIEDMFMDIKKELYEAERRSRR